MKIFAIIGITLSLLLVPGSAFAEQGKQKPAQKKVVVQKKNALSSVANKKQQKNALKKSTVKKPLKAVTKAPSSESQSRLIPREKPSLAIPAPVALQKKQEEMPSVADAPLQEASPIVVYTSSGFSPANITVKMGTTVTFRNETESPLWVGSDPHPSHHLLPDFDNRGSVGIGGTYAHTFQKVGTWNYHNHFSASKGGTVIVE